MRSSDPVGVLLLLTSGLLFLPAPTSAQTSPDSGAARPSLLDLLETPVSAASRYSQNANEAPASVVVITADDIERYGYENLIEALVSIPGMYLSADHNYRYLGVRGFSRPSDYNNRIILQIDGLNYNDHIWDGIFAEEGYTPPMEAIERIEVVRGPGSSVHGGNAMFAVVNVVTRKGAGLQGGRVSLTGGSLGYQEARATFGKEFGTGWDVLLSGQIAREDGADFYFEELDDPYWNGGRSEGLDWLERASAFANVSRGGGRLFMGFADRRKGIPTGAWETLLDGKSETLDRRWFAGFAYAGGLAENVRVDASFSLHGTLAEGDYSYEPPSGIFTEDAGGSWLQTGARLLWDAHRSARIVTGVDVHRDNSAWMRVYDEADDFIDSDTPTNRLGLFSQVEFQPLPSLGLTLGGRFDRHSSGVEGVTPRVAVIYHPTRRNTIKVMYGRAFRTPTLWERSYDDGEYYRGNPDLQAEQIRTGEVWWESVLGDGLALQASYYRYRVIDLIDEAWDEEVEIAYYENLSEATAQGLEVWLRGGGNRALSWNLGGSLQEASARATGSPVDEDVALPNSPTLGVRGGLAYQLGRFNVSGLFKYDDRRTTLWDSETESFWLVGARASARVGSHWLVRLSANNLFDTEYRLPGGWEHTQESLIQRGRTVRIALSRTF